MKLDLYKNMKLEGKPVIYEKDTSNVYAANGDFLCHGSLDGSKLKRAKLVAGVDGKLIEIE